MGLINGRRLGKYCGPRNVPRILIPDCRVEPLHVQIRLASVDPFALGWHCDASSHNAINVIRLFFSTALLKTNTHAHHPQPLALWPRAQLQLTQQGQNQQNACPSKRCGRSSPTASRGTRCSHKDAAEALAAAHGTREPHLMRQPCSTLELGFGSR